MALKIWRRHDSTIWGKCWNLGYTRLHWAGVLSDNFQNINVCWNEFEDVEDVGSDAKFVLSWPASLMLMDAEFVQSRSCFVVNAAASSTPQLTFWILLQYTNASWKPPLSIIIIIILNVFKVLLPIMACCWEKVIVYCWSWTLKPPSLSAVDQHKDNRPSACILCTCKRATGAGKPPQGSH